MGKFTKDKRVLKSFSYSKRDVYYRKAKEDGFRARSAYKLLQIDEEFNIFQAAERFVDLCAAPGSWSQIISQKLTERGFKQGETDEVRGISVDLQEIAPIDNMKHIQGDITKKSTLDKILELFRGEKAQLVICDGAPDVTGFHDIDQYIQSQLLVAALNITTFMLEEGGTFVAKIFQGNDVRFLYSQFKVFFKSVEIVKPKSSRASSVEAFIVCRAFDPPKGYKAKHFSALEGGDIFEEEKTFQDLAKFVTAGDLSCYDEDIEKAGDYSPTKFKPRSSEKKKLQNREYQGLDANRKQLDFQTEVDLLQKEEVIVNEGNAFQLQLDNMLSGLDAAIERGDFHALEPNSLTFIQNK